MKSYITKDAAIYKGASAASSSKTVSQKHQTKSVSVYLRIRPPVNVNDNIDPDTGDPVFTVDCETDHQLVANGPPSIVRVTAPWACLQNRKAERQIRKFKYNEVFPQETSQANVYETVARPLVNDLLKGHNSLLLVYGLSHSGKTHTALGSGADPGLLPRMLIELFENVRRNSMDGLPGSRVLLSMLEIHSDGVYDLLRERGASEENSTISGELEIQERSGFLELRSLSKHVVNSPSHGLDLIATGSCNRHVGSNQDTEGSTSVCSLYFDFDSESCPDDPPALWIADIVGDKKNRCAAARFENRHSEASRSGIGLGNLWRCLELMRHNQTAPSNRRMSIPFRESKLTHLFMSHLAASSSGKMVMIVNINTQVSNFDETQNVLCNSAISQDIVYVEDEYFMAKKLGAITQKYRNDGQRLLRRMSRGGGRHSMHKAKTLETGYFPACDSEDVVLSGAESDSALVDPRQGLVRCLEDMESQNEYLVAKFRKFEEAVASLCIQDCREFQLSSLRMSGQNCDDFIDSDFDEFGVLRILTQLQAAHNHEIAELEAEFEHFLDENGLDEDDPDPTSENLYAQVARLTGELATARYETLRWRKAAKQASVSTPRTDFPPSLAQTPTESPSLMDAFRRESRTSSSPSGGIHRGSNVSSGVASGVPRPPRGTPFSPLGDFVGFPTVASPPVLNRRMQVVAISRRATVLRPSYGKSSRSSGGRKRSSGAGRQFTSNSESIMLEKEATFFSKLRLMVLKVTPMPGQPRKGSKGVEIPLRIKKTSFRRSRADSRSPTLDHTPASVPEYMGGSRRFAPPFVDTNALRSGNNRIATPKPWVDAVPRRNLPGT